MTKIYFVRHCEATGNLARVFQGSTNTDITELGAKQLEKLSERFKKIQLDIIYTSPLLRARKTAEAICGDRNIEIIEHHGITELDGGFIENKPIEVTFERYPDLKDAWLYHPHDFAPEGGEKMTDAYVRIDDAFWNIVNNNKGKTIACASHGGVIRCLLCKLIYNDITKLVDIPIFDNTAICYIEIDDNNKIEVKFINDYTHLPADMLRSASRPISYVREN